MRAPEGSRSLTSQRLSTEERASAAKLDASDTANAADAALGTDMRGPLRGQRRVLGLEARLGLHVDIEVVVDPVQQRPHRPEVVGQALAGIAQPLEQVVVDGDVCTAKAVDALLGVTDDEQFSGHELSVTPIGRQCATIALLSAQIDGDLGLQWVGVLELIDEHALVASLNRVANGGVVAEQVTRPREEVVEARGARRAALADTLEGEIAHVAEQGC